MALVWAKGWKEGGYAFPSRQYPSFLYCPTPDRIKKGVREFLPERNNLISKKAFCYFIASITVQIRALELYSGRLNPDLKEKMAAFKKIVASLGRARTHLKNKRAGLMDSLSKSYFETGSNLLYTYRWQRSFFK